MEAEQVIEKILADAKAQAEQIRKEAEKAHTAEQADVAKELAEYNKQTEAIAKKAGEDKKSHLLAAARMDIAKEYLAEKRRLMDEVFAKSLEKLKGLDDEQYRQLVTKLMRGAIESGDEEVVVDTNETRINEAVIAQVNKQLTSDNKKGNLTLSADKLDMGGGFILRRGKIQNNVSFDVLITQARKELEIDLAKELF